MAIEFEVKLSDGVTAPAGSAAHQVDVLTRQLRSLQTQMIKANALGNEKAFNKAAESYGKLSAQVEQLGGVRLPKATAQSATMTSSIKAVGSAALATAAAVAAAVAAVAAFVVGVGKAIATVADLAQQQRALENTFTALGRGTTSGKQMAAMFDELGKVLPMSRAQMAELNKTMMQGGVTDIPRLMQATKAAAAANALMGDESGKTGEKIAGLVVEISKAIKLRQGIGDIATTLEGTGISAEEVAAKMGIGVRQLKMMAASGAQLNKIGNAIQDALIRKGAGPMRDMMSTWTMVSSKMKDSAAKLFSGITETRGFKAFSEQLVRLLGAFDGQAGRTKGNVTTAFDAIFMVASKLVREIRLGFLRAEIAMLQFQISIAPLVKAMDSANEAMEGFNKHATASSSLMKGLKFLLGAVAGSLALMSAPFIILGAAIAAVATALTWLLGQFVLAGEYIYDSFGGWVDAGADMINGLIKGIKKGAKAVKDAVVGLAGDALDAFKGALGIASPSKVFAQFGVQTTAGYALGVRQSAPAAMSATNDMASKAAEGGKQGVTAAPYAGGARGGLTVNVGGITIQGGGNDAVNLLEEAVVSLFERVALTQGVA